MGLFNSIKNFILRIFSSKASLSKSYGYLTFINKNNYGLSFNLERMAVKDHNNLIQQFNKKNKRFPTRYELGRIIVRSSHITHRPHTIKGHSLRQKIRHYLFNLHNISYFKI